MDEPEDNWKEYSDQIKKLTFDALNLAADHNFGPAWEKITQILRIELGYEQMTGGPLNEATWKYAIEAIKGLERAHDRRRGKTHD